MSAPARDEERALLVRATLQVLRRNGWDGAQVSEILAEAGLGTRAFYRHFRSKDELLVQVFEDSAEESRRRIDEILAEASDPREQLLIWIDELLDFSYDRRRSGRARLFTSAAAQATLSDAGDRAYRDLYEPLVAILESGLESGAFPSTDPELDAASIHALVWRFCAAAIAERPITPRPEARAHVLRFVLPAIGAQED